MPWFTRLFRRTWHPGENANPSTASIEAILRQDVALYHYLPRPLQRRLPDLVRTFLAEKEFWGSRDLQITDRMKVVVAAQACMLIVNVPRLGVFPQTREIVLYPDDFGDVLEAIGPDGQTYQIDMTRIGEASRRGPVLLAWQHVKAEARDPLDGYNVVLHEFAHVLDYMDGEANGAPLLENPGDYAEWSRVMQAEHDALKAAASRGRRTLLDPYGAQNPAEFFAVATEHFFEQGYRLRRNHPALYAQLKRFYQLDPAAWG